MRCVFLSPLLNATSTILRRTADNLHIAEFNERMREWPITRPLPSGRNESDQQLPELVSDFVIGNDQLAPFMKLGNQVFYFCIGIRLLMLLE